MRLAFSGLLLSIGVAACNPFYSVEQSIVERGYRWIGRGNPGQAISTFEVGLRDYPNSGLVHLGMADALAEARRERDAVAAYTKALPLLGADGHVPSKGAIGSAQTIGERTFSYQNQGMRFPYGVEAYLYFRRGLAYEALARTENYLRAENLAAAKADFGHAQGLAPGWKAPELRLFCLAEPSAADCLSPCVKGLAGRSECTGATS